MNSCINTRQQRLQKAENTPNRNDNELLPQRFITRYRDKPQPSHGTENYR